MSLLRNLFPDTTQEADKAEGTFGETQVLISGKRMVSLRGNEFGVTESFAYASRQFLGFKPSLMVNAIEGLGWCLLPSFLLNVVLGLYTLGMPGVILFSTFGLAICLLLGMMIYAMYLSPSLSGPISVKLGLLTFALVVL